MNKREILPPQKISHDLTKNIFRYRSKDKDMVRLHLMRHLLYTQLHLVSILYLKWKKKFLKCFTHMERENKVFLRIILKKG